MKALRIELTSGRRRAGLSTAVAAAVSGVWQLHIEDFENQLGILTEDEDQKLRVMYADLNAALDECQELPNLFDARSVEFFIGQFRQRREARERQEKFLNDNCLNTHGRRDPEKVRTYEAAAAAEATKRTLEKVKAVTDNAKAEINYLAGPKK